MQKIINQHNSSLTKDLYQALFLAIPVSSHLRDIFSNFGISHLIAISGFHLGVISIVLYWFFYILYSPIHTKYIPYRNKKFDLLIISSIFLFGYLYFLDLAPSFLRAFVMFILGIYFLRNNIAILSFKTLLLTTLIIIAIFPKMLFSLSFWFSIVGVFYIFLFLKYFSFLSKTWLFIFLNFWIFFAFTPIVHYFFPQTSYLQLLSPIITMIFTIFYPVTFLAHLVGLGDIFDTLLIRLFTMKFDSYTIYTNLYFFYLYIIISLLSILPTHNNTPV
jgi:competence protein ComEC